MGFAFQGCGPEPGKQQAVVSRFDPKSLDNGVEMVFVEFGLSDGDVIEDSFVIVKKDGEVNEVGSRNLSRLLRACGYQPGDRINLFEVKDTIENTPITIEITEDERVFIVENETQNTPEEKVAF